MASRHADPKASGSRCLLPAGEPACSARPPSDEDRFPGDTRGSLPWMDVDKQALIDAVELAALPTGVSTTADRPSPWSDGRSHRTRVKITFHAVPRRVTPGLEYGRVPGDTSCRSCASVRCRHCALAGGIVTNGQVKGFRPVTDAMLQIPTRRLAPFSPDARRLGLRPLKQITGAERPSIQLAWSWGLAPGLSSRRAVSNGMMFVKSRAAAWTLAAANGDLLWEYRARPAGDGAPRTSPMRNLAV